MAGDDVTITIRANNGDAIRAFRDINGQLRDMRGRFVAEGNAMTRSMNQFGKSVGNIKGYLIPLATAAVPLMASMTAATVKTAGAAAGAGVAVGAFGVALAGQVSHLTEAAEAQTKYEQAVVKSGRGSKEAAEAQRMVQASLAGMPNATARASVALGTLKDTFQTWSDDLAGFTMAPVEKSFTVLGQVIPKLKPMVKGASTQLDRLVSVAGGAVASPGFDALAEKFSAFANESLRGVVDGIIHFTRALSEGQASGPIQTFMDFAAKNGPALRETLGNVGDAVLTLVEASAQAGPGMLTLVNAGLQLVAALPPELVATVMQLAVGLKLVSLAGAGAAAAAAGVQALGTRIAALQAASAAAGGGMAGLRAAFMSLGTAAKASVVVGGIAILAVALSQLSSMGKEAPPNVDRMTTSLGKLAQTGKVSGEAARVFGQDFDKLGEALGTLARPSNMEATQQFLTSLIGMDSTPVKNAKEAFEGLDESLTAMVRGGKADLAAEALKMVTANLKKQGFTSKEVKSQLDDYKSALADQALEQELVAQSMGLFGQQAQATSEKLAAQKTSADGLRQSIEALNDANRNALGGMIGFEAAIDTAAKAALENAGSLDMVNGKLDVNSPKAQAAASALNDLASKTKDAALAARESGDSWQTVSGIYDRGRSQLVKLAQQMGLTKSEAAALADQILKTPNKTAMLKGDVSDLKAKLEEARDRLAKAPLSKRGKIWGDITDLNRKLAAAQAKINGLKGRIVNIGVNTVYSYQGHTGPGGIPKAEGGPIEGGSGIKDDVPILAMGGEFVINKRSTAKHRPLLEAINEDRLPKFAKGGSIGGAARGARDEIRAATAGNTERNLLRLMDSISKGHMKMASALTKVNSALESAKSRLDNLRSSATQLRDSVKGGVLSAANITRGAGGDTPMTVRSIMGGLVESRDEATAFADALKRLRKRGLNKTMLRQIAEAGIEGGGLETAGALLRASGSELKSINSLQSQISKAAGSAGKTTADAVYGRQIKAQERLVKSLDRLADLMKAITTASAAREKAREKVRKKAAGGIAGGLTWVGEDGPELVRLPHGSTVWPAGQSKQMAWASMLNAPRAGGVAAPVSVAASQPIIVHQTITLDGRVVAQQIFEPLKREVRNRGGLEPAFKTTR